LVLVTLQLSEVSFCGVMYIDVTRGGL